MMSKNKIFKVFITFSTLDVTFLLYVLSSLPLDCHHQFFIYDNGYCFDFCCLLSPFLVLLIYYIIAVLLSFPLNKWFPFSFYFFSLFPTVFSSWLLFRPNCRPLLFCLCFVLQNWLSFISQSFREKRIRTCRKREEGNSLKLFLIWLSKEENGFNSIWPLL